ncbi:MAG: hypothetical protein M1825_006453 [Sarcosagium campestre]|nr:MAG: hypothetical protein M1825_006453 [Sarcosagium campestre]
MLIHTPIEYHILNMTKQMQMSSLLKDAFVVKIPIPPVKKSNLGVEAQISVGLGHGSEYLKLDPAQEKLWAMLASLAGVKHDDTSSKSSNFGVTDREANYDMDAQPSDSEDDESESRPGRQHESHYHGRGRLDSSRDTHRRTSESRHVEDQRHLANQSRRESPREGRSHVGSTDHDGGKERLPRGLHREEGKIFKAIQRHEKDSSREARGEEHKLTQGLRREEGKLSNGFRNEKNDLSGKLYRDGEEISRAGRLEESAFKHDVGRFRDESRGIEESVRRDGESLENALSLGSIEKDIVKGEHAVESVLGGLERGASNVLDTVEDAVEGPFHGMSMDEIRKEQPMNFLMITSNSEAEINVQGIGLDAGPVRVEAVPPPIPNGLPVGLPRRPGGLLSPPGSWGNHSRSPSNPIPSITGPASLHPRAQTPLRAPIGSGYPHLLQGHPNESAPEVRPRARSTGPRPLLLGQNNSSHPLVNSQHPDGSLTNSAARDPHSMVNHPGNRAHELQSKGPLRRHDQPLRPNVAPPLSGRRPPLGAGPIHPPGQAANPRQHPDAQHRGSAGAPGPMSESRPRGQPNSHGSPIPSRQAPHPSQTTNHQSTAPPRPQQHENQPGGRKSPMPPRQPSHASPPEHQSSPVTHFGGTPARTASKQNIPHALPQSHAPQHHQLSATSQAAEHARQNPQPITTNPPLAHPHSGRGGAIMPSHSPPPFPLHAVTRQHSLQKPPPHTCNEPGPENISFCPACRLQHSDEKTRAYPEGSADVLSFFHDDAHEDSLAVSKSTGQQTALIESTSGNSLQTGSVTFAFMPVMTTFPSISGNGSDHAPGFFELLILGAVKLMSEAMAKADADIARGQIAQQQQQQQQHALYAQREDDVLQGDEQGYVDASAQRLGYDYGYDEVERSKISEVKGVEVIGGSHS